MHSANAARNLDEVIMDEAANAGTAPPTEQARYEPRYRVVQRKALSPVKRSRGLTPMQRTLVLTVVPTLFLLTYVLFWTLAMRGGFVLDRYQAEYKRLMLDQRDYQADVRAKQAPGVVLPAATAESGLEPGTRRLFAPISASALKPGATP